MRTKTLFLLGVMGIFIWGSFAAYKKQVVEYRRVQDDTLINYVKSVTAPDESVLILGAESYISFFAQRKSPTRFVYQYPLYEPGYVNEEMVLEFLSDIINNRTRIIIDPGNSSTAFLEFPIHTDKIDESIAYLKSHYRLLENPDGLTVYEFTESESVP